MRSWELSTLRELKRDIMKQSWKKQGVMPQKLMEEVWMVVEKKVKGFIDSKRMPEKYMDEEEKSHLKKKVKNDIGI